MKNRIALGCLLICSFGCHAIPPIEHDADLSKVVSLQKINVTTHFIRYRMTSRSADTLMYVHWLGQGPEPVPYCKFRDGAIHMCALKVYVADDEPSTHETVLPPGKTVTFEAQNVDAVSVGVLFLVNGQERYVWADR